MNLIDGFKNTLKSSPEKTAIIVNGSKYSYGQVDKASQYIAHRLIQNGISKGDCVGILMNKGAEAISSFCACMKLGAPYIPLDCKAPPERLKKIIKNCQIKSIIVNKDWKQLKFDNYLLINDFFNICSQDNISYQLPELDIKPEDVVYILHTSGSTGIPKGIRIMHKNICNFITWTKDILKTKSNDIFANHAPFYFDISTFDIYGCFEAGATLIISTEREMYDPSLLLNNLIKYEVTIWYSVPSILTRMVDDKRWLETNSLRHIIFAGEPYPVNKIEKLLSSKKDNCSLYNFYGPTETNVCTYYEVPENYHPERPFPIGKSIHSSVNTEIIDNELVVYGPCVMKGYVNTPDLEEEKYATGDIVSRDSKGNLIFHGRKDSQVKVRGIRIEIGEIENTILKWDKVESVVVTVEKEGNNSFIRAHIEPKRKAEKISLIELKLFCRKTLPIYMIPHYLTIWDELPKNKNGKIDRNYLQGELWKL